MNSANRLVAAYYYPNYHQDPRNATVHGPNWTEWELVRRARSRFPGQIQPLVPLWGYEDESDPNVMAKKIEAAATHGVDAFLFDWYYYDDGPFLERCVKQGFMLAPNCEKLRFALMWANHDWMDIHPAKRGVPARRLYPGTVTPTTFRQMTDYLLRVYFSHPSYMRVNCKPFFSIYDLETLVRNYGSVTATRSALDNFRWRAERAGYNGLHLNAIMWSIGVLEGERPIANLFDLVYDLGFDSVTSYVWVHHVPLSDGPTPVAYDEVERQYFAYWEQTAGALRIPFFPNVTVGWDTTPRTEPDGRPEMGPYPYCNRIVGNTPERFELALSRAQDYANQIKDFSLVTVNAWNEWTEGSYLEPDTRSGTAYLKAIQRVMADRRRVGT